MYYIYIYIIVVKNSVVYHGLGNYTIVWYFSFNFWDIFYIKNIRAIYFFFALFL